MVIELSCIHVESFMFNEIMRKATPYWQKISRATVKANCRTRMKLKRKEKIERNYKSVKKINITTDMWTSSSHQIGYMIITAHWIASE